MMEDKIKDAIMSRILEDISDTRLLNHHCRAKLELPDNFIDKVYATINWDDVVNNCISEIQNRICDTIVQSMITEIKTDTKKVLQIDGVRQKLRAQAYPKVMEALEA